MGSKNQARSCEAHRPASREISLSSLFFHDNSIQERVLLLILPLVTCFRIGEEMACLRPQGSTPCVSMYDHVR